MGLIMNNAAPMEKIYENYGVTVEGKWNKYESSFTNEVQDALVDIKIGDYTHYFGNRYPFKSNVDRSIDNICWWIAKVNPTTQEIDDVMVQVFEKNTGVFNYRIENQKVQELREQQQRKESEQRELKEKQKKQNRIDEAKKNMNKKIEKLAHKLKDTVRSVAMKENGRYLITDMHQILETPFPIEGIDYDGYATNLSNFMDEIKNGYPFYGVYPEDFKTVEIIDDLKNGIKEVAGRKYGDKVVWHGAEEYPYMNARYVKDCIETLKCKQMTYATQKFPVYFFYKDDFDALIKMCILPMCGMRKSFIGFKNVDTGVTYDTNYQSNH